MLVIFYKQHQQSEPMFYCNRTIDITAEFNAIVKL